MVALTDRPLKCDCHNRYVLAVVVGDRLVIKDRRDRQVHEISINLDKLKELMLDSDS